MSCLEIEKCYFEAELSVLLRKLLDDVHIIVFIFAEM